MDKTEELNEEPMDPHTFIKDNLQNLRNRFTKFCDNLSSGFLEINHSKLSDSNPTGNLKTSDNSQFSSRLRECEAIFKNLSLKRNGSRILRTRSSSSSTSDNSDGLTSTINKLHFDLDESTSDAIKGDYFSDSDLAALDAATVYELEKASSLKKTFPSSNIYVEIIQKELNKGRNEKPKTYQSVQIFSKNRVSETSAITEECMDKNTEASTTPVVINQNYDQLSDDFKHFQIAIKNIMESLQSDKKSLDSNSEPSHFDSNLSDRNQESCTEKQCSVPVKITDNQNATKESSCSEKQCSNPVKTVDDQNATKESSCSEKQCSNPVKTMDDQNATKESSCSDKKEKDFEVESSKDEPFDRKTFDSEEEKLQCAMSDEDWDRLTSSQQYIEDPVKALEDFFSRSNRETGNLNSCASGVNFKDTDQESNSDDTDIPGLMELGIQTIFAESLRKRKINNWNKQKRNIIDWSKQKRKIIEENSSFTDPEDASRRSDEKLENEGRKPANSDVSYEKDMNNFNQYLSGTQDPWLNSSESDITTVPLIHLMYPVSNENSNKRSKNDLQEMEAPPPLIRITDESSDNKQLEPPATRISDKSSYADVLPQNLEVECRLSSPSTKVDDSKTAEPTENDPDTLDKIFQPVLNCHPITKFEVPPCASNSVHQTSVRTSKQDSSFTEQARDVPPCASNNVHQTSVRTSKQNNSFTEQTRDAILLLDNDDRRNTLEECFTDFDSHSVMVFKFHDYFSQNIRITCEDLIREYQDISLKVNLLVIKQIKKVSNEDYELRMRNLGILYDELEHLTAKLMTTINKWVKRMYKIIEIGKEDTSTLSRGFYCMGVLRICVQLAQILVRFCLEKQQELEDHENGLNFYHKGKKQQELRDHENGLNFYHEGKKHVTNRRVQRHGG